ncbi:LysR family transcriptional regulator [Sphingobium cloacae]|uniref:LysR family transcriptional regulator n=1 Tax=Sphingobium cloacae TaxID=120107 RepID=A0A1E1F2L7_9SPHN|nr:LysR family transcriptional regulator [Sphingobium cloacae]BAV64702.1 LysR family transcriptional regulator [Sphingobium cloacae]
MMMRDLPSLDLRQLYYFLTVAEQGSISGAASALEIAQPSLSANLGRLERKLQVQLVIRTSKGIRLTQAGRLLSEHSRRIVGAAAQAIDEIRQTDGETRDTVSIGLPPSLGLLLSVPLAETIQNECPHIRLRITEAMSGDILEWMVSERLDLGCAYEVHDSLPLSFHPLLTEQLFLVTASDNLPPGLERDAAGIPVISAAALPSLPLALPGASHGARKVVERFARSRGLQLNVVLEIDSLPQIVTMTARASAYTILPHAAVIDEVAAGTLSLVRIVEPSMIRTAYLVRKRTRPAGPAISSVEQAVKMILREMVDRFQLEAAVPSAASSDQPVSP